MTRLVDLTGRTFGRYAVIGRGMSKSGKTRWICRCECGVVRSVLADSLTREVSHSCGCWSREVSARVNTTHGHGSTKPGRVVKTHRIWASMIGRCNNPRDPGWHHYGGRGIAVCDRWKSYANFLADMGEATSGLSINRIDNNRGYEPENCRWATLAEQSRNTRRTKKITVCGVEMVLKDACRHYGLMYTDIFRRSKRYNIAASEAFFDMLERKSYPPELDRIHHAAG